MSARRHDHAAEAPRSAADLRFDAVGVIIDGYGLRAQLDHLEAAF